MNNKFIVVDGVDGCGKTTSIEYLKDYLISKGQNVHLTKAIGSGKNGLAMRQLLLESKFDVQDIDDLLVLACHINSLKEVNEYLSLGYTVIHDRYLASYWAYNFQVPFNEIGKENRNKVLNLFNLYLTDRNIIGKEPDLSLYIDISAEKAKERMSQRDKPLTYTDNGSLEYFQNLIEAFKDYYETNVVKHTVINNNFDNIENLYNQLRFSIDKLYQHN